MADRAGKGKLTKRAVDQKQRFGKSVEVYNFDSESERRALRYSHYQGAPVGEYMYLTRKAFFQEGRSSSKRISLEASAEKNLAMLTTNFKTKVGIDPYKLMDELADDSKIFVEFADIYKGMLAYSPKYFFTTVMGGTINGKDFMGLDERIKRAQQIYDEAKAQEKSMLSMAKQLQQTIDTLQIFKIINKGKKGDTPTVDEMEKKMNLGLNFLSSYLSILFSTQDTAEVLGELSSDRAGMAVANKLMQNMTIAEKVLSGEGKVTLSENDSLSAIEVINALRSESGSKNMQQLIKVMNMMATGGRDRDRIKKGLKAMSGLIFGVKDPIRKNSKGVSYSAEVEAAQLVKNYLQNYKGVGGSLVGGVISVSIGDIKHTGNTGRSVKLSNATNFKDLERLVFDDKIKDSTVEIILTLEDGTVKKSEVGFSTKAYSPHGKHSVSHSTTTLAKFLALASQMPGYANGAEDRNAAIVNTFLLQSLGGDNGLKTIVQKDGKNTHTFIDKSNIKKRMPILDSSSMEDIKVFYMSALARNFLETQFMYIDGVLIPAPIYYDFSVQKLVMNEKKGNLAEYFKVKNTALDGDVLNKITRQKQGWVTENFLRERSGKLYAHIGEKVTVSPITPKMSYDQYKKIR